MITEEQRQRHIEESQSLTPEPYVFLYSLKMKPRGLAPIQLYFSPKKKLTWQGVEWEDYACHISGHKENSSGEMSRPSFSVYNPEGLFSRYAHDRWMDNAEVARYKVLREHIDEDINSFVKHSWRVNKYLSLNRQIAVFELRSALDGQFFVLPGRAYYPPEFPTVSLG